jgi:glucose-1-phosphate cytidylyltransferase
MVAWKMFQESGGNNKMKAVILAGGLGTRISEETHLKPKPMIEIGGKPIIWHIMKIYSSYGVNDFIICCGYKGYVLKEYFANYYLHQSDVEIDIKSNSIKLMRQDSENWTVTLVDTGEETQTGGRIARVRKYLEGEECFFLTYGDGLSDVNIQNLFEFHKAHSKQVTVSAVHPPGRFGAMSIKENQVIDFIEKPIGDGGRINGGFFVVSTRALDVIKTDGDIWEVDNLPILSKAGEVMAFEHNGFWQPMDTLRDKNLLEQMWKSKAAKWKKWNN